MRSEHTGTVYGTAESLQAAVSSMIVPLAVSVADGVPFWGRADSANAGEVVVARIAGGPQGVVDRRPSLITSTDREYFVIVVHRQGRAEVEQDGRRHRACPGELVSFDTTRPYRLRYDGPCDVVVLTVPRTLLGARADAFSRRTAIPMASDHGTRAVVSAFFGGLGERLDDLPGPTHVQFSEALAALLVAAFEEPGAGAAESAVDLVDRIAAYVLANLADPGLCVESVACRFGISPRQLHRLFARRGRTFADWLREERLRRVRRDLADPACARRTIAAVAARWGLYDAGHLSRAFKSRYGLTPAEVRRLSTASGL